MRADRLLSLLMLLQSRGRMTAAQLAQELEVSERTIYRDVTALGTSGVPVMTDPGPGGGISLVDRYRTDLTGLTEEEVQALFMLSVPAPLADIGLDRRLKEALYKLSAALPAVLKNHEQQVRQRIHIDSDVWEVKGDLAPFLPTLKQAIWSDRMLSIEYRSLLGNRTGLLNAELEPYGLVAKSGKWYLVAFRIDHMSVVQVDRIVKVSLRQEPFRREPDFNLVHFWQAWCIENQDRRPRFETIVQISADLRQFLPSVIGDASYEEIEGPGTGQAAGWSKWRFEFGGFDEARGRILALGAAAIIIEPLSLRLSVRDYAQNIINLYLESSM